MSTGLGVLLQKKKRLIKQNPTFSSLDSYLALPNLCGGNKYTVFAGASPLSIFNTERNPLLCSWRGRRRCCSAGLETARGGKAARAFLFISMRISYFLYLRALLCLCQAAANKKTEPHAILISSRVHIYSRYRTNTSPRSANICAHACVRACTHAHTYTYSICIYTSTTTSISISLHM